MKNIRIHLLLFVFPLVLSGVTAFPIRYEIELLYSVRNSFPDFLNTWVTRLYDQLYFTPEVIMYGTDWLAFAHIVISLFFIPILISPVQYKGNLQMAMAACILIFPLAFICGPLRGIPFFHQLIDCSFGLTGFLYLLYILRKINKLQYLQNEKQH